MKPNLRGYDLPFVNAAGLIDPLWFEFLKDVQGLLPQAYVSYTSVPSTPTTFKSFNVNTLVKNAAGDVTITFKEPISNPPLIIGTAVDLSVWLAAAPTANVARVRTGDQANGTLADATFVSVVAFGPRN